MVIHGFEDAIRLGCGWSPRSLPAKRLLHCEVTSPRRGPTDGERIVGTPEVATARIRPEESRQAAVSSSNSSSYVALVSSSRPLITDDHQVGVFLTACPLRHLFAPTPRTDGSKAQTIETTRQRPLLAECDYRGPEYRGKSLEHHTSKGRLQHRQRDPHNDKSRFLSLYKNLSETNQRHAGLDDQ